MKQGIDRCMQARAGIHYKLPNPVGLECLLSSVLECGWNTGGSGCLYNEHDIASGMETGGL